MEPGRIRGRDAAPDPATPHARQAPAARALEVRLPLGAPPSEVLVDGTPAAEWRYEAARAEVVVTLQAGNTEIRAQR